MTDMLDRLFRRPPAAPFVSGPDRSLSYGEAFALVSRKATELSGHGPLVVAPRRGIDSILELLAAIATGRAVVVVDPDDPRPVPTIAGVEAGETIVFTSGASGSPKGVRLTPANWTAAVAATTGHMELVASDRWLLVLPLHHVGGLSIVYRCVEAGASIMIHPVFDPVQVGADLTDRATVVSLVPVMVEKVLAVNPGPFPSCRWALVGGGPATPSLWARAAAAGLAAVPSYGMTETAAQIAAGRPGDPRLFPLIGVDLRISGDGAIQVRGEMVSPGYAGEPRRASGEFLTTGDRGEVGVDGELKVIGRLDRIIVSGGENVDPVEVEAVLSRLDAAGEVAVVGLPDPDWGEVVAAVFTGDVDITDLERAAETALPASHRPKRIARVTSLPRNVMGKVDLEGVRALFS